MSTAVGAAVGYLAKQRTRNDEAIRQANEAIYEDLVIELQKRVEEHSERLNGMVFAVDRELDRFAAVLFAHQVPLEIAAENRPRFIRSAKLPGERLFWLARDGDYLVELASE